MNLVLLRGLGREKAHWLDFPEKLEASLDIKTHLVDHPGMGEHTHLFSPTKIKDYSKFLMKEVERLNIPKGSILLGHSLGGMIALDCASREPGFFSKVILINTSDGRSKAIQQRLRFFGLKKLVQILLKKDIKEKEIQVLEMISNNKTASNEVLDPWVNIAKSNPMSPLSLLNQAVAASQFTAPTLYSAPLHFLTSKGDKMVSHECSEILAKDLNAKLHMHQWAGHDLVLDDPEWVVETLRNILKE
ncbi:MAG: alpha/beta fold hydrolase [Bdellovibrionales bacterium]